jgi:hypothetical protein
MSKSGKSRKGSKRRHQAQVAGPPEPRLITRESKDPADWGPVDRVEKIMPPPVDNMLSRGAITEEQYRAAREIEEVFHSVSGGLMAKAQNIGEERGGSNGDSVPMLDAYVRRYRPWADEISGVCQRAPDVNEVARVLRSVDEDMVLAAAFRAERRVVKRREQYHQKTLRFMFLLVINGMGVEAIAASERIRVATVREAVKQALTRYAEIAGWVRRAA